MGRLAILFFEQPRLLWLLLGMVTVSGLTASQVLPRMEDPLMKPRAATIRTVFPGASTERVETLVTDVIERELLELEDIRLIRSGSRNGYSLIALELRDEIEEVEPIWGKIRDKLADAETQLPPGVQPDFENLEFRASTLIVSLRWTSSEPTQWAVLGRLAKELQSELRGVHGTDKIDLYGLPVEQVLVEVSQQQLATHGLTMGELAQRLQKADAKVSAGSVQGQQDALLVELAGDFDSLQRLSEVTIRPGSEGRSLTLGQVAKISKTVLDPMNDRVLVEGQDAVVLVGYQRQNRRIDLWTADAAAAVERFAQTMPVGIEASVDFEQSRYVMQRLTSLLFNLGVGAVAVMLVVLWLMGWRGSLLVGLTLPVTCLAVLTSMWMFNIPLHQMSVTGMILALGLLIDNAIVIVDEVQSALNEGVPIREAILDRVKHLAVPLWGSTLTTVLAFMPLIIMIGPAAEFVYAISTSVIAAIISSYLLSMTVLPALMGWLRGNQPSVALPAADDHRSVPRDVGTSDTGSEAPAGQASFPSGAPWWVAGFRPQRMALAYRHSMQWLFQRPGVGVLLGLILPVAGFVLATRLPEQFFPSADRDQFTIKLELAAGKTSDETLQIAKQLRETLLQDSNIKRVDWYVGRSCPPFYVNLIPLRKDMSNFAQAFVELSDGVAGQAYLQRWQERLQLMFPAARVNVQQLQLGPPLDDPIEIRIFGPDPQVLTELGEQARRVLASIDRVTATTASLGVATPTLVWEFDPHVLDEVGVQREDVANQLSMALDGVTVGAVLDGEENVPVRLRLAEEDRSRPEAIASLTLNRLAGDGTANIPLAALGAWQLRPGDSGTQRLNNRRVNEVRAQVETGYLPSLALAEFDRKIQAGAIDIPPGYQIKYGGESEERDRAVTNLVASAPVLVLIMFSSLVLSFGSFRGATLIGCVGVLSIGLGLFSLFTFGYPFGFMAIVGTMGLVGVAINDSIVVLAGLFACPAARRGEPQAVAEVVIHSTRHILATSLTTIAGFLPLLWQGGGFWPPLAIAIAGGVGGATILALYFVPSLFLISTRYRRLKA